MINSPDRKENSHFTTELNPSEAEGVKSKALNTNRV